MHALRRVHEALAPDGLLLDVYPRANRAPVEAGGRELGRLDDDEWDDVVRATQGHLNALVAEGRFEPLREIERDVLVRYPSAEELLEDVAEWRGTRIPGELPALVRAGEPPLDVRERVVYRLFRRR